jgi:peptidoglycan/xylan/chitin deacetylase (PgdA/CDA1 family)
VNVVATIRGTRNLRISIEDVTPRVRAAGRCLLKNLAETVVPSSLIAWRGRVSASSRGRPIALTFDDGPDKMTPEYLDVLGRFRARATFFVVGEFCAARPDLVSAIAAGGHELCCHGYTHRRFPRLSAEELRAELLETAVLLPKSPTGPRLVRPPHGAVSLRSTFTCARAGFTTTLWSHDSGDSRTTSERDVCMAFRNGRAPGAGSIVLLHEGQPWTLRALPTILGELCEAGHEFVTVGELLAG